MLRLARGKIVAGSNDEGLHILGLQQSGKVKNKSGSETLVSYESAENLELLGTLCSNKTWNAEEGSCDCECKGYVLIRLLCEHIMCAVHFDEAQ